MKKIIHLSDLHGGHKECGPRFRAIIDNITFLKQPAGNYIVVITGDIINNAGSSTHKKGDAGFQRIIDLSNADPRMDYDGNFI